MSVKSKYFLFVVVLICLCAGSHKSFAQPEPKRELRAAWIATVANIDWPSKPGLSVDSQKAEFIRLLNMLQKVGMNAVVVQVRPATDAFYTSTIEPWSYWLTGSQGVPPIPFYDPLKFMIVETHKRGMEFHAWFNPYRAVFNIRQNHISSNSITRLHPDWFLTYGNTKYFNPGLPQVWDYLVRVIRDVVKRYNIDAVQFDDYFYPYRIPGKAFPDYSTYKKYGAGMSPGEWRRHNVDTVIQMLSKAIKEEKAWVKFGISPFGVWRNHEKDPEGSMTRAGQTNYDDLYADVLLWLKKGWIDYVCPQLYWDFNQPAAPYGVLLDWWAHHTYGRQLFIGQGLYRLGSNTAWRDPSELPRQIKANRTYPNVKGSIYFSASKFYKNTLGFNDTLENNLYRYPAIPPTMPWIDSIPPAAPHMLSTLETDHGLMLQWKDKDTLQQTTQFVLYRFKGTKAGNYNNPTNILAILNIQHPGDSNHIQTYTDEEYVPGAHYVYALTALDRLHNESNISNLLRVPFRPVLKPLQLYHIQDTLHPPLPLKSSIQEPVNLSEN